MRRSWKVALLVGALMVVTAPALAQPLAPARDAVDLKLRLEIGRDGFRLGTTILGLDGVYGAWLNGALRPDGVTVEGRVQHPDRAYDFTLEADVGDGRRGSLGAPGHGI
jgi:hypothetical protein